MSHASPDAIFSSTTGQVLDFIIRELASGRYSPGQRLNAASLAKELKLSKAPIREALHVLAGEGVVDMPKNRGAFIRELSQADLLRLWEMFSLTFGREIRSAARNVDKPDAIDRLNQAMAAICVQRDRGPSLDFYKSLHGFHGVVATLSDNPFLVTMQVRRLGEFWLPYILRAMPLDVYIDFYTGNYQRICDALVAGDGATAESAFHYHAKWSAAVLKGLQPPPAGPWCDEGAVF
jgi:DNA-binding GntR family transcriptional regulator